MRSRTPAHTGGDRRRQSEWF